VGLAELVCTSPENYVAQAVALGHDPARLAQLKAQLQANLPSATLFQPQAFVATLEDAYRQVWHAHTAQAPIDAD
jgi:predicted O-linked N-acetylglucosamine transferase (SPINDLY family)